MSYGTHRDVGDVAKREAQYNASMKAAGRGMLEGVGVAAPAAYLLNKSWPVFRGLTPAIKASLVFTSGIVVGVIRADKAGIAFDQERYSDRGASVVRRAQTQEQRDWEALSKRDKALTWAKENKFGVVAASWVTSMGLTFAYIHTQPLSFAQKLVQARVWAQGLTLASLVGMAAIVQIPSDGDRIIQKQKEAQDHSWRDFIEDTPDKQQDRQQQQKKGENAMNKKE